MISFSYQYLDLVPKGRDEAGHDFPQSLSLAKECYGMKLDLLTNATVVDDAIRFVSQHGKSTTTVSSEVGTRAAALKHKINTVEDIQDAEHRNPLPSNTTNQVF